MANCNCSCNGCSSGCSSCNGCGCNRCRANVNGCATRANGCSALRCSSCGGSGTWSNRSGCGCNSCSHCGSCNNGSSCGCSSCNSGGTWSNRSGCVCNSCSHCGNGGTWSNRGSCGTNCRTGCNNRRSFGCLSRISNGCNNCGNWNWRHACLGYDPLNLCQNYENFPFYSGPCGTVCPVHICNPCDPDGCCDACNSCCNECCDTCNDCCNCDDDCECDTAAALAVFTARAPMDVCAGGRVELTPATNVRNDFAVTPEGIRIRRAGIYLVTYTVHVPAFQNFSSQMYLTLNGETIAASHQDVTKLSDSTSNGSTAQVLVHAGRGDLLALASGSAFSLVRCESVANVFTLSIVRVE